MTNKKNKKLLIVTGASRGLGLELSQKGLNEDYTVIGIARNKSISHENYFHLKMDLSKSNNLMTKLDAFFIKNQLKQFDEVTLINNAAMVTPINFIEKLSMQNKEVLAQIELNLVSPILLSSAILSRFNFKKSRINIVNISSGAAKYPIHNWSIYCSSKAGLKMFTETLNHEYGHYENFRSFNFYPGVMDTEMQATIRQQKSTHFKEIERFKALKTEGRLLSAQWVAEVIFDILNRKISEQKSEYDVKDYIRN